MSQQDSIQALAVYLGITYVDAEDLVSRKVYAVYTEEEAKLAAYASVKQSLWLFNYRFLSLFSEEISSISKDEWQSRVRKAPIGFNEQVLSMVRFDDLVELSIREDGLGNLLGAYNGDVEYSRDGSFIIIRKS